MKPSVLIGIVLAVIAGIGAWRVIEGGPAEPGTILGIGGGKRSGSAGPVPIQGEQGAPDEPTPVTAARSNGNGSRTASPPAPALDPAEGEREAGGGRPSAFRLVDGRGDPVAGAHVSWCTRPNADEHPGGHEAASVGAPSDEAGRVFPPGVGETPESEALVWITHAEHVARWAEPGEYPQWKPGAALVLEEAPRLEVRVTDRAGEPVEGALVVQRGLSAHERSALFSALPGAGGTLPGSPNDRALACLERLSTSDETGRAAAFPSRLPTVLWASAGKRRSAPVRPDDDTKPLTLVLDDTFAARGTVWSEASMPLARVLGLAELSNGDLKLLGSSGVAEGGTWGPIDLPLLANAVRFVFRLEGGDFIPLEEVRAPPSPGALLTVEFRPELGNELLVRLVEKTPTGKVPVPHGRVTVSWVWREDDERRHQARAWADEEGEATVRGTPTTLSWLDIEGSAGGFVAGTETHIQCPNATPPGKVFEIVLERAGRLHGRCLRGGEPVEDFKVIYWYDLFAARKVAHFSDRKDGSFEITTAPVGEVTLLATVGSDLAQSAPAKAEVTAEGDTGVLLEVAEPTPGVGAVLDAVTGKPVPGATVDPQLLYARSRLGSRGRTFRVDADGSFEVECFAAEVGRITASAPGYSSATREGSFRDGRVDFGVIALSRPQKLRVELVLSEPIPERGVWLTSQANGHGAIPLTRFPSNGVLELEDVEPGTHMMDLCWHGGGMLGLGAIRLSPGREWVVRLPFETPAPVIVEFVTEEGREPLPAASLVLRFPDHRGGVSNVFMGLIGDRDRIEVPLVTADEVTVEVMHDWNQDTVYASVHERFAPGGPRVIRVPLFGPKLEARVIDGDGNPVRDATVSAIGPGGLVRANELVRSDGTAVFEGLRFKRVSLFVQHNSLGLSPRTEVDLSLTEDTFVELKLDCDDDLAVRLMDGSRPIPGAPLTLYSPSPRTTLGYRATDSDGRASWERVGHGTYRVEALPANCWDAGATFEFKGDAEPLIVQVRRLGNLAVEVVDADGQGVAGLALDLHSSEFDTAVSTWVDEGRVQASTGAVVTGAGGSLLLSHLPRGSYAWRIATPGAPAVQGQVNVEPLSTATLHLTLP